MISTDYRPYGDDIDLCLSNCLLVGGAAYNNGGAVYAGPTTALTIEHCTIAACQCYDGPGGAVYAEGPLTVRDSIIYGNWPDAIFIEDGVDAAVSYCNIEGGWPGPGNFDVNPLFATGPWGPWYLSHTAAGQAADSPCVDAGSLPAPEACGPPGGGGTCLDALTTRADHVPDAGTADLGFHFRPDTPVPLPPLPTPGPPLGVRIELASRKARPGETFWAAGILQNPAPVTFRNVSVFFILDAFGEFYFWPSWRAYDGTNGSIDYGRFDVRPGSAPGAVIPPFVWPETGEDAMDGLVLYGAMFNPFTGPWAVMGAVAAETFGYGP